MESREQSKTWYWTVNRQHVEVSQEVYRMIRQDNTRIRNKARTEHRCAQQNYTFCHGDCLNCYWHTEGRFTPIETMQEEYSQWMEAGTVMEEEVLSKMTMENVYDAAEKIIQDGGKILRLRFEEGLTQREIARLLGVPHGTVGYRLKVLLNHLRENANIFF